MNTTLIKDTATRKAIDELYSYINAVDAIKQLPATATLSDVIRVINQITNSRKRI